MESRNKANHNFDKYAHEAHKYFNELAEVYGHPDEQVRASMIWRAVMHVLRDRMHPGEVLDLISPLPLILKGMMLEGWKYREKPLYDYTTIEQMKTLVKAHQNELGEYEFNWEEPTADLISLTLDSLKRYVPESQMNHIRGQLPKEVQELVH